MFWFHENRKTGSKPQAALDRDLLLDIIDLIISLYTTANSAH